MYDRWSERHDSELESQFNMDKKSDDMKLLDQYLGLSGQRGQGQNTSNTHAIKVNQKIQ